MPDKVYHECRELISQGKAVLEDLQDWGFDSLPVTREEELPLCPYPSDGASSPQACRPETLAELEERLRDCPRCPLCKTRRQVVFGVGKHAADAR